MTMITNEKLVEIERAVETDDAIAEAIGLELSQMLHLKPDRHQPDRIKTAWGSKTNIGLARSVLRVIADKLTVH